MKYLLLAVVASLAAFLMAFTAAVQVFGIQGKIDTSQFVLGPSWKWVIFDVVVFFWNVGITAGLFYFWMVS